MRLLVVGCGSIGLRHMENLLNLGTHEVLACDTSAEKRALVKHRYKMPTFATLQDALQEPIIDAALICTPSHSHVALATQALKCGLHVFVEKPISHTADGVLELINLADRNQRLLLVGQSMRFNPNIVRLRELVQEGRIGRVLSAYVQGGHYLPQWRPEQDYRTVYSSHREQGGGVILDYLHDFDYLRWILGEVKEVFCVADKLSDLEIDSEDHAVVLLRMESGSLATLQADYLRRRKWRSCEFVGERGVIKWEASGKGPQQSYVTLAYDNQTVEVVYEDRLHGNEDYEAEIRHFVACLEGREAPRISGLDGLKSLFVALAAQKSHQLGRWIVSNRFDE